MTQPDSSPVESATPADTSTAATDNSSPATNVGQPDIHAPGMPPGGSAQVAPNRIMVRRARRSDGDGPPFVGVPEEAVAPNVVTVSRGSSPTAGPATAPIQVANPSAADGPGPTTYPETGTAPGPKAAKSDWVTYAVDSGAAKSDAEAMTKDQLIETYGSQ